MANEEFKKQLVETQDLLNKAIADRNARPWRYYKLEWGDCQRIMDQLLAQRDDLQTKVTEAFDSEVRLRHRLETLIQQWHREGFDAQGYAVQLRTAMNADE